jgi:hypothetical protein
MYRFVAICHGLGLSPAKGEETARDVVADFAAAPDFAAQCEWKDTDLILHAQGENEDDHILILDYFRKCIEASCGGGVGAGIYLESVDQVDGEADESEGTEEEGYELLALATKLELKGRVQEALVAYQQVAVRYSRTAAGHDAGKSIESLRAKIG